MPCIEYIHLLYTGNTIQIDQDHLIKTINDFVQIIETKHFVFKKLETLEIIVNKNNQITNIPNKNILLSTIQTYCPHLQILQLGWGHWLKKNTNINIWKFQNDF
jgi:hypothetical protein